MEFDLAKLLKMAGSKGSKQGSKNILADAKNIVALVNLRGEIREGGDALGGMHGKGTLSFESLRPLIQQAFDLPNIVAVVMIINSPGGSPVQTNLIASFIMHKKTETKNVPVFAFVEDVAASGGYWLACAADAVYLNENSMVGSIGAITLSVGVSKFLKEHGINSKVLSTSKNKSSLNPFEETSTQEEGLVKESLNAIHQNFVHFVQQRRKKIVVQEVFSGKVYVGEHAVKMGLADGVSSLSEVLDSKFPGEDLKIFEVSVKDRGNVLDVLANLMQQGSKALLLHGVQIVNRWQNERTAFDVLYHDPTILL